MSAKLTKKYSNIDGETKAGSSQNTSPKASYANFTPDGDNVTPGAPPRSPSRAGLDSPMSPVLAKKVPGGPQSRREKIKRKLKLDGELRGQSTRPERQPFGQKEHATTSGAGRSYGTISQQMFS